MRNTIRIIGLGLLFSFISCKEHAEDKDDDQTNQNTETMTIANDVHSFGKPNEVAIKHMHLDLAIDFKEEILQGSVRLDLENKTGSDKLHLDTKDLTIKKVTLDDGSETKYQIKDEVEHLGQEMIVDITPETKSVTIEYATSEEAEALQWLSPEQTSGGEYPFLFSQSQAILARSWIPCQDGPGVKFTYTAKMTTDPNLMVLMSAENGTEKNADGIYTFKMEQPVSSYLMALTAGDLEYRSTGRNSGVYAEPNMLEASAWEFADMQSMIDSAEELYGPYQWGQYDVVVLPPSFPFGGMENPRLTFATPTIIAGDRSLVSLIAHELAHSWSGNLVTNETWNDFWLNEGFTVYFEQRIMEKIYGQDYADMETKLGMGGLKETIADLTAKGKKEDTHLYLNLEGRNPDDGLTDVAYEKGRFFLQTIEKAVGREKFDAFLKGYFTENAFKAMNTERFLEYLDEHLYQGDAALADQINADAWVYGPGLPDNAPDPHSSELDKVEAQVEAFVGGTAPADLDTAGWTTHHWLYFLRALPEALTSEQMAALDASFGFTDSGNSEILCDWFQHCIQNEYKEAYPKMEHFLTHVGRRKFLTPLYKRLVKTEDGTEWAKRVFELARPGYHFVSENTIQELLYPTDSNE